MLTNERASLQQQCSQSIFDGNEEGKVSVPFLIPQSMLDQVHRELDADCTLSFDGVIQTALYEHFQHVKRGYVPCQQCQQRAIFHEAMQGTLAEHEIGRLQHQMDVLPPRIVIIRHSVNKANRVLSGGFGGNFTSAQIARSKRSKLRIVA